MAPSLSPRKGFDWCRRAGATFALRYSLDRHILPIRSTGARGSTSLRIVLTNKTNLDLLNTMTVSLVRFSKLIICLAPAYHSMQNSKGVSTIPWNTLSTSNLGQLFRSQKKSELRVTIFIPCRTIDED
jgi:hypothetical protein